MAFAFLLLTEMTGRVFASPRPVADSVETQFELPSLVPPGKVFLEVVSPAVAPTLPYPRHELS